MSKAKKPTVPGCVEFLDEEIRNMKDYLRLCETTEQEKVDKEEEVTMFTRIKSKLLRLEQLELLYAESESICDACEWFDNPGECPDYDESKCHYNAPMEEDR